MNVKAAALQAISAKHPDASGIQIRSIRRADDGRFTVTYIVGAMTDTLRAFVNEMKQKGRVRTLTFSTADQL